MFKIKGSSDLAGWRFIDLFAGIGGFHIALAAHGATCVMASEIEKRPAKVYERNYGLKPRGDITQIDAAEVPAHDIICAGFPCQPFSSAGKRLGLRLARQADLRRDPDREASPAQGHFSGERLGPAVARRRPDIRDH